MVNSVKVKHLLLLSKNSQAKVPFQEIVNDVSKRIYVLSSFSHTVIKNVTLQNSAASSNVNMVNVAEYDCDKSYLKHGCFEPML